MTSSRVQGLGLDLDLPWALATHLGWTLPSGTDLESLEGEPQGCTDASLLNSLPSGEMDPIWDSSRSGSGDAPRMNASLTSPPTDLMNAHHQGQVPRDAPSGVRLS